MSAALAYEDKSELVRSSEKTSPCGCGSGIMKGELVKWLWEAVAPGSLEKVCNQVIGGMILLVSGLPVEKKS